MPYGIEKREVQGNPYFSVPMTGPWRVHFEQGWWVVGNGFAYPANDESSALSLARKFMAQEAE